MARKSKGFGELLNSQQRIKGQQESMDKLAERVKQGYLKDIVGGVVRNPKGEVKMSEVLQAFVEPHLDFAATKEQRQKLFAIAILAWNLALLSEEQQQKEMEDIIAQMSMGKDRQAEQDIREILEELTERKRRLFPNHRRYILDFDVRETRNDFHLSVISSPTPKN
ncbi:MAG: hypothetical protein KME15_17240 [Drouetiella hepatica Uher 2000/2452]|jgi:hypothetical protein|uniref:Uncharacterized protein n=1 Tax=Drouetiella hepatica Uher 2000/2452 TaxID=904376 RepID=A0A951QEP2_9CYAN|nr:hypothetical protein [Drouetiella hepatica Uher 2000/2452]